MDERILFTFISHIASKIKREFTKILMLENCLFRFELHTNLSLGDKSMISNIIKLNIGSFFSSSWDVNWKYVQLRICYASDSAEDLFSVHGIIHSLS